MIIKTADSRQRDLDTLAELAERPDLTNRQRRAIEAERRKILAGLKGEAESAYHLDFHTGGRRNWILIHDLRIEHDGRVAQIDHMLINRFLDVWLFESKHFGAGLSINAQGECTAWYGRKGFGVPSPFEQNRRHIAVLQAAFRDGAIALPTRLGMAIRPAFEPRVLVASGARITRPPSPLKDLETLVKADQVGTLLDRDLKRMEARVHTITKIVSRETLYAFGERLTSAHSPIEFDWLARFGLPATPEAGATAPADHAEVERAEAAKCPTSAATQDTSPEDQKPEAAPEVAAAHCAACGASVSAKVVAYCENNAKRFKGHIFCYSCQRNKAKRAPVLMAAE